jgi:hypothetical protein
VDVIYCVGNHLFVQPDANDTADLIVWDITESEPVAEFYKLECGKVGVVELPAVTAVTEDDASAPPIALIYALQIPAPALREPSRLRFWQFKSKATGLDEIDFTMTFPATEPPIAAAGGLNTIAMSPDMRYTAVAISECRMLLFDARYPDDVALVKVPSVIPDYMKSDSINFLKVLNGGVVVCGYDSGMWILDAKPKSRQNKGSLSLLFFAIPCAVILMHGAGLCRLFQNQSRVQTG